MVCIRCKAEIGETPFCPQCGASQAPKKRSVKKRGNGQGSVYRRGEKYQAEKRVMHGGISQRETKLFAKKGDAIRWLALPVRSKSERGKEISFRRLYDLWQPTHGRAASTMGCYQAAMNHFAPLWSVPVQEIDIDDLQDCVDDCESGRRTRENMKALAGLLYKYGIPRHYIPDNLNLGPYLKITGEVGSKAALTAEEVERIRLAIGKVPCADQTYCLCYLGFRPSEALALQVEDYNRTERAITGGGKTEAGRDRTVTVSPKILPLIEQLIGSRKSGHIFTGPDGQRQTLPDFRARFYALLDAVGVDNPVQEVGGKEMHRLTPHSCRHTFATMMKHVPGADRDKLELMGHTSTEMLRHYQDVSFEDLRRITDRI